jgi:protoheme IX farnesyltransferase
MTPETLSVPTTTAKVRLYAQLLKFRLSALVVFSGAFGFLLANDGAVDWFKLAMLCLGSFMITGAANTINQIIERDLDKLMKRTSNRPLPTGRLSVNEAVAYTLGLMVAGTAVMVLYVNVLSAALSLFSLLLYGFAYTPLKQKSSFAVFVGAFPGAFPPLIGWAAQTGQVGMEGLILFAIQFIWQFPHFWSIAWVADEDYRKAGFRLLPSGGERNFNTAFSMMSYTLFLVPIGLLPAQYGMTGTVSVIVVTLSAALFLAQNLYLMKVQTDRAAKLMMFGSFLYLPIVQIAFLLDKV